MRCRCRLRRLARRQQVGRGSMTRKRCDCPEADRAVLADVQALGEVDRGIGSLGVGQCMSSTVSLPF